MTSLGAEHRKARKRRVDPLRDGARADIATHLEIFLHRQRGKHVGFLRHIGKAGARDVTRRPRRDIGFAKKHAAGFRLHEPGNHLQQRRFAGTVRADDAHDFTGVDAEINALQDFIGGAIARDDARDLKLRHQCALRARRPI